MSTTAGLELPRIRGGQPGDGPRRTLDRARSRLVADGHVLVAVLGALAWVLFRPAVADLQAADARAAAAARGVGLTYWLSWYSGTAPGDYSMLSPTITATLGVTTSAALSVVLIALLARPLLAGTFQPRLAAYLVVACAVCNLWSGRVPFGLGAAFALGALLLLRRGRPLLGGAVNAVAGIVSPLAPAFVLLGLVGWAVTRSGRRADVFRFGALTLIGLAAPTIAFGVPGHMPYVWTTLLWTIGILLAALCVPLPAALRISLLTAIGASLVLFLVPNGVGANMSRFAYLAVPAVVLSASTARIRYVLLALLPAVVYCGYNTVSDVAVARHPAAKESFYTPLRDELLTLPGLTNHRVEVVDTDTHRAAAELVPAVYLARGWEDQSDTAANPIFYGKAPLTAASYRTWLDQTAVAWIAVPSHPGDVNAEEAQLATSGLGYLREIWQNGDWRLYQVSAAQPIVSAPATVVSANETTMVIDVPRPATITFRLRPSKYLQLSTPGPNPTVACLTQVDANSITARVAVPGRYQLDAPFRVSKLLGAQCVN